MAAGRLRSIFSSRREFRLWAWVFVLVATIFSTLGLAQTLAGSLRSRGLFDAAFIGGFLLIVVAVVMHGLKARPGGLEMGVVVGIVGVYLMVFARLGSPEERTHLFEYGLVAILVYAALEERRDRGRRVPIPAVIAIVTTALVGWLDEGIQSMMPSRVYDLRDVGFNVLAAVLAVTASATLAWTRRAVGGGRA